jgi:cytochrome c556
MKFALFSAALAAVLGVSGIALAQQDIIAERRAGMSNMGRQIRPMTVALQAGDARAVVTPVAEILAFMATIPDRFPAQSLTPPVAQGRNPGQTRAGAAIDANRADFLQRRDVAVAAWTGLSTALQAGTATPDMLRAAANACDSCHERYWVR